MRKKEWWVFFFVSSQGDDYSPATPSTSVFFFRFFIVVPIVIPPPRDVVQQPFALARNGWFNQWGVSRRTKRGTIGLPQNSRHVEFVLPQQPVRPIVGFRHHDGFEFLGRQLVHTRQQKVFSLGRCSRDGFCSSK